MSNNNSIISSQLPLFAERPLPEVIADNYNFSLAYLDHNNGKRYYAVQDWIIGVAQTDRPSAFWKKMKNRLAKLNIQLLPSWEQLKYIASDGKKYNMDFAQAETLYQITQRMDTNTGLRNAILVYLAKAGVIVDDQRVSQNTKQLEKHKQDIVAYQLVGKSEEWAVARVDSKESQKAFVATLYQTHESNEPDYPGIAGIQNKGLFDMSVAEIVDYLGLLPKHAKNWRDYVGRYALMAVKEVNYISGKQMKRLGRTLTSDEQKAIVRDVVRRVGPAMRDFAALAGEDFLSGASFDESGRPMLTRNVKLLESGK